MLLLFQTVPCVSAFAGVSRCFGPSRIQTSSSLLAPQLTRFRDERICHVFSAGSISRLQRQTRQPYRSLSAKPKRGSVVESYQTVSVNCSKCRERLFRYKKKNGTKSNLVKCFVERISEDSAGVLEKASSEIADADGELPKDLPQDYIWECPKCRTQFARSAMIKGLPALKMVGGKIKMTKK
jgi:hypothetical protein